MYDMLWAKVDYLAGKKLFCPKRNLRPVYIGEQTPFRLQALLDRVLPARNWEMPVERKSPAKLGQCSPN